MKFLGVFPIEFATVDDTAAAQVEEICGDEGRLGVVGENVGVIALGGSDALALFNVLQCAKEVAICGGLFEEFFFRGGGHALFETLDEIVAATIEEETNIVRGFGVTFLCGEAGNAGAETAMNVILEA